MGAEWFSTVREHTTSELAEIITLYEARFRSRSAAGGRPAAERPGSDVGIRRNKFNNDSANVNALRQAAGPSVTSRSRSAANRFIARVFSLFSWFHTGAYAPLIFIKYRQFGLSKIREN